MRVRFLAAVPLVVLAASVNAAEPRAMTAVDLLSVPVQSDVQLAPGGGAALFVRSQADWEQDKTITHVWKVAADGSGLAQMTNGKSGESSPRWSPDGTRFCFVATRGGETAQLFVQQVGGGEAFQVSTHETSVSDPRWLPDGKRIAFLADEADSKEAKAAKERSGDVVSYDRNYHQKHLWVLDLEAKSEKRLTEGAFSVLEYDLSRDGATLVYSAAPSPLVDDEAASEVFVRPFAGGEARRLTENHVAEHGARLSPDGASVLFTADANQRFEPYYQGHLFVVPASGGAPRMLAGELADEIADAEWAPSGGTIVLRAVGGVREQLWLLDAASSRLTRLTSGESSVISWMLDPASGAYAALIGSAASPGDVWFAKAIAAAPARATRFAEDIARAFFMPRVETISWSGADGQRVEGLLTYPIGVPPGARAPLVVQTHGGPAAASTFRFASWATYAPVLAAKGYLVLDPNYRGSTGYGDAFLRDMVGHYFHQADKDVLAGVDTLVAKGLADPDKLVAMGWSAGGHMTNWLVVTTDRFKAAASGAGAADWISMYAQSDVRTYRTPWFGGSPWQKDAPLGLYLEQSPIAHVSSARTPTLLMVGEKDVRVPTAQSIEMFRALRASGVDATLLVFPGEPHGLRTLKHRLYKINSEIAWFEKHLFGRAYTLEEPPETARKGGSEKTTTDR